VLLQDHSIRCWTVGDPIPATAAVSGAIAVWGGPDTNAYCYDLSDGSFACVDPDALQGIPGNLEISTQRDPALVNVQSVAMSDFTACATLRGGSIRCWGIAGPRLGAGVGTSVQVPFSSPWDLAVADVSASPGSDLCFASTTSVTCWGTGRYTSTAGTVIPLSNPDRLAAGNTLFCGSNSTTTTCWGITNSGDPRLQIPADVRGISRLGVGARHACAVRAGTVECWGDNSVCQAGAPGAGPAFYSSTAGGFQSLSVGANHTCALTAAGDLYCWGSSFGCDPTVKVAIP
jgi:alpha-tubulin suppressor-like RCC1 family protein